MSPTGDKRKRTVVDSGIHFTQCCHPVPEGIPFLWNCTYSKTVFL
ncbi:hypothetical protein T01_7722 [Trichinella spiralis]|uniref:Uncharacterized protein n=1 Tax=Trichinella spiralis TaxID=6334 RepID=A0A0V0YAF9_TRISP|nr:hypothetical protein T01_7722 [Trichinella spiralis]